MLVRPSRTKTECRPRTIDQILHQGQTFHFLPTVSNLEVESLVLDSLATLVLLFEPLVHDRALASRNVLRGIEGVEVTRAPKGSFIFIKGVLCRCVDEPVRCDGIVVEISSDRLSNLKRTISMWKSLETGGIAQMYLDWQYLKGR
jgi:hypothetical protein